LRTFGNGLAERTFYVVGLLLLGSADVPVTAKLSKALYDRLGEQIANELVEWFNQVDITYRNDLRDFNELNFQRFAARMDERLAASEAKGELGRAALESKLVQRLAAFESNMEQRIAGLEAAQERRLGEHTRWMFAAWAAMLIPIIGLWFRG
jgi:hypothetical protein